MIEYAFEGVGQELSFACKSTYTSEAHPKEVDRKAAFL